jgi:futalosine hydrolase
MSTIVIAATELELAWLIGQVHARQDMPLFDFPVYHAAGDPAGIRLITSGPGMANAAAASAAAIERYRPARICNIGICGVYAQDSRLLGKAVIGTHALFADTGVAGDTGFQSLQEIDLPLARSAGENIYTAISLNCDGAAHDSLQADFLTVAGISGSPDMARKLCGRFTGPGGALLCEDMESAAVGLVALRAGTPCTVVRGISNVCGERDHARWKITQAAQAAQKLLLEILGRHEQTA